MDYARIKGLKGTDDKIVTAKDLGVNDYYISAAENRLVCTGCEAAVTPVENPKNKERPFYFRVETGHKHDTACTLSMDFAQALEANIPILVKISFKGDDLKLKDRFNGFSSVPQNGLYTTVLWLNAVALPQGYAQVSAQSIEDVLYYLKTAKKAKDQSGMKQLWFQTDGIVQSCARFVVAADQKRIGNLITQMIKRLGPKNHVKGDMTDTPRLFRVKPTQRQIDLGRTETSHQLYCQLIETDAPAHIFRLGLLFSNAVNNQHALREGHDLWVIGAPEISRKRLHEIQAKTEGTRKKRVEPAYIFLHVSTPKQYIRQDVVPKKPAAKRRNGPACRNAA